MRCRRLGILLAFCVCLLAQKIDRVALMPDLPAPLAIRDWRQAARDYDKLAFDFDAKGQFLPLIVRDGNSFSLFSYIGTVPTVGTGEGINALAAVVSASLCGIDKSRQDGRNFVAMCRKWFVSADGQNLYMNLPARRMGETFWYELLPNILAYQLNDLYPGTGELPKQVALIADRLHQVAAGLGGRSDPFTVPDFEHLSFNLETMRPVDNGRWKEPDSAAGIAWLEYMAWTRHRDPRYLTAARWGMGFLDGIDYNPYYEMLLPYGAYLAARMNAEQSTNYNVGKLLNWCFDGTCKYRRGWGVIADRWSGLDAHGLVGSITDGGGYAFAMDTWQQAGALAPLVRYDARFAHDIGKWLLNVANNSRLFYPNALDAAHQSSYEWSARYDPKAAIAYEGIRKWKRGAAVARADFRTPYGRVARGNYASTALRGEQPEDAEVLAETLDGGTPRLEHVWEFELPRVQKRWLVAAARSGDGGRAFRFSFADNPQGPFTAAFSVPGRPESLVAPLPPELEGKLYVKAESADRSPGRAGDELRVDAIAISYQSDIGPYAQGDVVVSFVDLIEDWTVPIVLYRPTSVATDLGLYGSSHAGILGGLVRKTNVDAILQIDLLKTDYYHGKAYPTYLYYNPYGTTRPVEIDLDAGTKDLYDAATGRFLRKGASGRTSFRIAPDTAVVLVVAPAGGKLSRQERKVLIDGIPVSYAR